MLCAGGRAGHGIGCHSCAIIVRPGAKMNGQNELQRRNGRFDCQKLNGACSDEQRDKFEFDPAWEDRREFEKQIYRNDG